MCILKCSSNPSVIIPSDKKVEIIKQKPTINEVAPAVNDKPDESATYYKPTFGQKAWVTCGCITLAIALAKTFALAASTTSLIKPGLAALAGYIIADLVSGLYHWAIDNYGNRSTPIFGSYIVAFQDHHKRPWTITKPHFTFNIHILAQATTVFLTPFIVACNDPTTLAFVTVMAGFDMIGLQIHVWSHETKGQVPKIVSVLQDVGVFMSRSKHAAHHQPPHNKHYCVVSGLWNDVLDDCKVFDGMEMAVFHLFGVKPRSWVEDHED